MVFKYIISNVRCWFLDREAVIEPKCVLFCLPSVPGTVAPYSNLCSSKYPWDDNEGGILDVASSMQSCVRTRGWFALKQKTETRLRKLCHHGHSWVVTLRWRMVTPTKTIRCLGWVKAPGPGSSGYCHCYHPHKCWCCGDNSSQYQLSKY